MAAHLPAVDTRTALLDAAQQFIQRDAYDGFSFQALADAVGIRKASIYHHFESKDAVAIALLERARDGLSAWALRQQRRAPPERLRAYCFELYRDGLGAGDRLCPAGSFGAGWSHHSPAVQAAAQAAMAPQRRFLQQCFRDGLGDGSLRAPPGCAAEACGDWFAATVQGALLTARPLGGAAFFEAVCATALAAVIRA